MTHLPTAKPILGTTDEARMVAPARRPVHRGLGVMSLLITLLVAGTPPTAALSCAAPPDTVWTTLIDYDNTTEHVFLAHDPGSGDGCHVENDHTIGAEHYIWQEGDHERQEVHVLDRATGATQTWVLEHTAFDLRASGVEDGLLLLSPVFGRTDFKTMDLATGETEKTAEHMQSTKGAREARQILVNGTEIIRLRPPGAMVLTIHDAAQGRDVVKGVAIEASDDGTPDAILAASDDVLVLAFDDEDRPGFADPWLYTRGGRAVRSLAHLDAHESGLLCGRLDGDWFHYGYHENANLPWWPTQARHHLVDGTHVVDEAFDQGHKSVCAPVHDNTFALFNATETREEQEDGTIESLEPTGGPPGNITESETPDTTTPVETVDAPPALLAVLGMLAMAATLRARRGQDRRP